VFYYYYYCGKKKMEKWIEIEDGFLLSIEGKIIGDDQDIIFYEFPCNIEEQEINNNSAIINSDGYFQFFYVREYLEEIWNSYQQNENNIIKQLEIDFYRQDYFINDQQCCNLDDYFKFVGTFYSCSSSSSSRWRQRQQQKKNQQQQQKYQIDILKQYQDILILMLSTQSSFAYIFETLQNYYPELYLVSSNNNSRPQIRIYQNKINNNVKIEMRLYRHLLKLETEKIVKKLCCNLIIDFSNIHIDSPMSHLSWFTTSIF
jgi:hypothetical protein